MVTLQNYEEGFKDFYLGAVSLEAKENFRAAISNYYKALTELCGYLVFKKLNKIPKNHSEIFLFLKTAFPEIYKLANESFKIYQETYIYAKNKEECEKVKDGIRKIIGLEEFSEKIKSFVEKE